jgi:hypothetical protein
VVARDVQHRHVEPADDVLEVVEGKVATAQNQVRLDRGQAVAEQRLIDLVGDGEDLDLATHA